MRIIQVAFDPGRYPILSFWQEYSKARKYHPYRHSLCEMGELALARSRAYHQWCRERRASLSFEPQRQFDNERWLCRLGVSDGMVHGGFIVHDGELRSLFSWIKGDGAKLIRYAISLGAVWLNCNDGPLVGLYSQFGFKVVRREANWVAGQPDVVYMELPAECRSAHCECSELGRAHCSAKLEDRQRANQED